MQGHSREEREQLWGELMARAQDGDSAAYDRLLRDILPDLRALVGARLRDPAGVEDVVQNVLFSMHRARQSFQPGRPFGPWMRAIARNAVIDAFRVRSTRLKREAPLEAGMDVAEASESVDPHAPLSPYLRRALDALPPAQREAVELIHLHEMSVAEAAARVGIKPGALKVRAHRGYKALRVLLAGGLDE
jgi:RNA polymerase sigma-70 factor (ECF subfamily)